MSGVGVPRLHGTTALREISSLLPQNPRRGWGGLRIGSSRESNISLPMGDHLHSGSQVLAQIPEHRLADLGVL